MAHSRHDQPIQRIGRTGRRIAYGVIDHEDVTPKPPKCTPICCAQSRSWLGAYFMSAAHSCNRCGLRPPDVLCSKVEQRRRVGACAYNYKQSTSRQQQLLNSLYDYACATKILLYPGKAYLRPTSVNNLVSVSVHAIDMILLLILNYRLQPLSQVTSKPAHELENLLHVRITERPQRGLAEPHDSVVRSRSNETKHQLPHRYFNIGTDEDTSMASQCSLHIIPHGCSVVEHGANLVLDPLAIAMKTHRTLLKASVACPILLTIDTASVVL